MDGLGGSANAERRSAPPPTTTSAGPPPGRPDPTLPRLIKATASARGAARLHRLLLRLHRRPGADVAFGAESPMPDASRSTSRMASGGAHAERSRECPFSH